jgi:aryl-alcohol dehydrogenase-like predicted oxidoreductase
MDRRRLGGTAVEVSRIILGCGNFGGIGSAPEFFGRGESEEEAFRIMDAASELGITTFDTADAYGGGRSETIIGKWMASRGVRPELITKTFNPMAEGEDHGLARPRVTRQLESSLQRLGVDGVDVYLAHEFDPDVEPAELVGTFEGLVGTGLIRAWGLSNVDAEQLRSVLPVGRPAVVQNSYSLLDRADEEGGVIRLAVEFDASYTPFSPLAGGWLTGKYKRDEAPPADSRMALRPGPYEQLRNAETFDALERFAKLAKDRGLDAPTLAFAWLFAQEHVAAVVVGPRRPDQLEPALLGLDHRLSQTEAAEVAALFV